MSRMRMALNRCTAMDMRWNKKAALRGSSKERKKSRRMSFEKTYSLESYHNEVIINWQNSVFILFTGNSNFSSTAICFWSYMNIRSCCVSTTVTFQMMLLPADQGTRVKAIGTLAVRARKTGRYQGGRNFSPYKSKIN